MGIDLRHTPHRPVVERLLATAQLSDWERQFLGDIARRYDLTAKQASKLETIRARADGETSDVDPKVAFLDAMEAAGVIPDEPIADPFVMR